MITELNNAKNILTSTGQLAMIIGNGINRYAFESSIDTSWSRLLIDAWADASFTTKTEIGKGISFTEFYDMLEMENDPTKIRESIVNKIKTWKSVDYHSCLANALKQKNIPVLTTNFDLCLELPGMERVILQHPTNKKGFTDIYPWNVVYTDNRAFDMENVFDFGIWHINGSIDYPRSLKLSLSEYTRQGKRAIDFLHSSKAYEDDFLGKNKNGWRGVNTWLHHIFNCDLFIFGLGLDEQETFLRWLLIERMKYFRKHAHRKKRGWYVCKEGEMTNGKSFFLERLGFEIITLNSYDMVYKGLFDI